MPQPQARRPCLKKSQSAPESLERLNHTTGRGAANILLGLRMRTGLPLVEQRSVRTLTLSLIVFLIIYEQTRRQAVKDLVPMQVVLPFSIRV